jgi:hypothetical protein
MKAPAKSSASSSRAGSTLEPSAVRAGGDGRGFELFAQLAEHEHEQVSVYYDRSTGYPGLIGRSGDPSPVTAYGVYRGMQACRTYRSGSDGLAGRAIAKVRRNFV